MSCPGSRDDPFEVQVVETACRIASAASSGSPAAGSLEAYARRRYLSPDVPAVEDQDSRLGPLKREGLTIRGQLLQELPDRLRLQRGDLRIVESVLATDRLVLGGQVG